MEAREARSFHRGDHVSWNSEAGHVTGTIVAVHTEPFEVNGYTHHASSDEPQYEIKSSKTDHVAYHKAGSLHHLSSSKEDHAEKHHFETIPAGTKVSWHYRSAIGHGTVEGVHKRGTSSSNTLYSIRQHDHHVSASGSKESPVVYHYGSALTRV
jgi:surface antigen